MPHKAWWSGYLRDRGGTSFWHETSFRRGGVESIFVDTGETVGHFRIGPAVPAVGLMSAARAPAERDRTAARATV